MGQAKAAVRCHLPDAKLLRLSKERRSCSGKGSQNNEPETSSKLWRCSLRPGKPSPWAATP